MALCKSCKKAYLAYLFWSEFNVRRWEKNMFVSVEKYVCLCGTHLVIRRYFILLPDTMLPHFRMWTQYGDTVRYLIRREKNWYTLLQENCCFVKLAAIKREIILIQAYLKYERILKQDSNEHINIHFCMFALNLELGLKSTQVSGPTLKCKIFYIKTFIKCCLFFKVHR